MTSGAAEYDQGLAARWLVVSGCWSAGECVWSSPSGVPPRPIFDRRRGHGSKWRSGSWLVASWWIRL